MLPSTVVNANKKDVQSCLVWLLECGRHMKWCGVFLILPIFAGHGSTATMNQGTPQQSFQQTYQEAQKAMGKGEYGEAIRHYQRLLEINRSSPELYFQLGLANYQKGDYEEASAALRQAVKLKSDFMVAKAFMGLSDSVMGRLESSIPLLEEVYRSNDADLGRELKRLVGIRLGKDYSDRGRTVDAETMYLALIDQYPNDTDVLYQSFWLHMTRARETMNTLLKQAPDSYRTHEMLGHLLIQKENYPAAVQQFRLALKSNPGGVGLHYELGKALLLASAPIQEIRQTFQEEVRLHPFHAASHYQLAELAFSEQDLESALRLYGDALRFQPNLADAKIGLCKISLAKDQLGIAETQCAEAIRLDPGNPSAHYVLARVYKKQNRQREAQEQLDLFQRLKRDSDEKAAQLRNVQVIPSEQRSTPSLPEKTVP